LVHSFTYLNYRPEAYRTMIPQQFDHIFRTKLYSWTQIRSGYEDFFTPREIDLLSQSERSFDAGSRTIVLLAFENEYASLGGLSVVTRFLPAFLRQANENVVFVTPYHTNHAAIKAAQRKGKFSEEFSVPFECGNDFRRLTCFRDTAAEIPSYFLSVEKQFEAEENPYSYSDPTNLLEDSLVFCIAVPFALARLGITGNVLFHANDWETAAIALSSKMSIVNHVLESAKTVLTLHNSYDAQLPKQVTSRYFSRLIPAATVLSAFIPLLNGPLTTVSTPFAHELRADPLQQGCFAAHLQNVFSRNPPIGIENGAFGDREAAFSRMVIAKCESGDAGPLLSEKQRRYDAFWSRVTACGDGRVIGTLAPPRRGERVPVFFLSGRLDFLQKGFDVVFSAFQRLKRGSAKLFFSPNVGGLTNASGAQNADLDFFKDIALRCNGDITIWPFFVPHQEYKVLLRGASFLAMPSLYEPFGAATEGFGAGTPVLARATGGLWIQVAPSSAVYVPPFYGSLLQRAAAFDGTAATGILYRERYPDALSEKEWQRILSFPLAERSRSPLYEAMVEAAHGALETAVALYDDERAYAAVVANGVRSLDSFQWSGAVAKYRQVYDSASRSVV
jgi:glycogen synthase